MAEDPGWGRPRDLALGAVAPQLALRRARDASGGAPPVVALRILSLSFAVGLLAIAVVVAIVTSGAGDGSLPVAPAAAGAGALALASVVAVRSFQRTLACAPPAAMVGAYRTRFLLRLAMCEAPALIAFVLSFLSASPVPYIVALPVSLAGMALAAPTAASLRAEDERLALSGCATSLHDALVGPTGPLGPTAPA